jgi:hypothetical protein
MPTCKQSMSQAGRSLAQSYLLLVVEVHFVVYHGNTIVASELLLVVDCTNAGHEGYCSAPLECRMTLVVRTSHRPVDVSLRCIVVCTYPTVFTVYL